MRNPVFCICEHKGADQLHDRDGADQPLFSLHRYFSLLYPKFQASSYCMWLYSLICVGPGQKPQDAAHMIFDGNYS